MTRDGTVKRKTKRLRRLLTAACVALGVSALSMAGCVTTMATGGGSEKATSPLVIPATTRDQLRAPATSACARVDFDTKATLLAAASVSGLQDIPAGVTPTGSSILVQRGGCSRGLSLLIVDESYPGSAIYRARAIPALAEIETSLEESVTLTADGLTIVGLTRDLRGFVAVTRSAVGAVDFGLPSVHDFAQITARGSQTFWAPALSFDGLAFYYVVHSDPNPNLNGIYESVRASTSVPFPPGIRMPNLVQNLAQYVNGLSADRLTIFLEERAVFRTSALTRARLSDPFTNPGASDSPLAVPGLRTRPLADCTRLVGTCAPEGGGCSNESVCTWGWQASGGGDLPLAVDPSRRELL